MPIVDKKIPDKLFPELEELGNLKEGWNGYDAKPICPGAISSCRFYIKHICRHSLDDFEITPEPAGDAGLTWRKEKQGLVILSFSKREIRFICESYKKENEYFYNGGLSITASPGSHFIMNCIINDICT